MKSLFEQLRPELKEILEQEKNDYPYSIDDIINTLKNKEYVSDVTIGESFKIMKYLNVGQDGCGGIDINKLFEIFNK